MPTRRAFSVIGFVSIVTLSDKRRRNIQVSKEFRRVTPLSFALDDNPRTLVTIGNDPQPFLLLWDLKTPALSITDHYRFIRSRRFVPFS
jgi:hypothetical protein